MKIMALIGTVLISLVAAAQTAPTVDPFKLNNKFVDELSDKIKYCTASYEELQKLDEQGQAKYYSETCKSFRRSIEALRKGQKPGPLPDPTWEQIPGVKPGPAIPELDKNSITIKDR